MSRGARMIGAVAVIVAMIGVVVVAVRASYGAFKAGYTLTGTFPRAVYGFGPNTEIDYLGVDVGHVTHLRLQRDHRVEAFLRMQAGFRVPRGTQAEVENRSLFGDPFINLRLPSGPPAGYLKGGDHIQSTSVDADTADLITHATPLLSRINGGDLLTLITELDQASRGEGPRIAASIHAGAQLAGLYASTINAQLVALDSFTAFQTAITPDAPALNTLAAQTNEALPTLTAAEADFQHALDTLQPFSADLANLIAQERPNLDYLLSRGDNVVRLLAMREPQVEQTVSGLALYLQKFATGGGPEVLPDGTKFTYFKNFIELGDIQQLICGLIAPSNGGSPAPPQLQPLVSALAGTALGCQPPKPAAAAPPPAPAGGASPLPPQAQSAASDLANRVAGQVGAPEPPASGTVGDLLKPLLGGP